MVRLVAVLLKKETSVSPAIATDGDLSMRKRTCMPRQSVLSIIRKNMRYSK